MRQDVRKFLFLGLEADKEMFFKRAQDEGVIHFIDPNDEGSRDEPEDLLRLKFAIKILRRIPPSEQEENLDNLNADELADSIIRLHEKNERLLEELRVINIDIARIEVFGNFNFKEIYSIENDANCHFQFFTVKSTAFQNKQIPDNLIYINSEYGLDYYLSVSKDLIVSDQIIEMKFNYSLAELKQKEEDATQSHRQLLLELKHFMKYNDFLHSALLDKLNHYHLFNTQNYVQEVMEGAVFAIEGWVPVNKSLEFKNMIEGSSVYIEEIAIEKTDVIPTYLENKGQARLGEDLVHIYDTPSATDKDPSLWVLYGFAFFFAFIIGDAGYGAVYLLLALFIRWKYPALKGLSLRLLNLFTFLCASCIVWGTLMTSFFGMQIAIDNPIRKVSLLQWLAEKKAAYHLIHQDQVFQNWLIKYPELEKVTDVHQFISFSQGFAGEHKYVILNRLTDNIMFEAALFVGVLHLMISLLRYCRRYWQNLGWAIFLLGAYLYFPFYLKTPSVLNFIGNINLAEGGKVGLQLMFIGVGLAWILSIVRNGWSGLFEIVTLIQIFADTLSYLRLYALGLAGAIVGSTINEIAGGLPLILGVLLVLIAHFMNIVLGTMSGVIHGLRLNFLEWYHYSFEGGGKKFRPLKLLKKE